MNKLVLVLFLIIPINIFGQDRLEFVKESIDFNIDNKRFSVNGIYSFFNNSPRFITQTIMFPFAKNTDSINVKRIYNLTYSESIGFSRKDNAIVFKISVLPKDTVMVNIAYSQKTVTENIYVLKSTKTWGKPLINANYSLTVNTSVNVDSLSLKPDLFRNSVYHWQIDSFYPDDDFKVYIK
jgi:hypothetical protein